MRYARLDPGDTADKTSSAPVPGTPLTTGELRTLAARARGCTDQQAATVLHVSINTVKTQLKRARLRLGAKSTAHAVALAIGTRQLPAGVALPPTAGGGELS